MYLDIYAQMFAAETGYCKHCLQTASSYFLGLHPFVRSEALAWYFEQNSILVDAHQDLAAEPNKYLSIEKQYYA